MKLPLLVAAMLLAGCANDGGGTAPTPTPAEPKPLEITNETPTPLSLWRNMSGGMRAGWCQELLVMGPGQEKKFTYWVHVRAGRMEVIADQVPADHVEQFACPFDNKIIPLTVEATPTSGVQGGVTWTVPAGKVMILHPHCNTDVPCDFDLWAQSIGSLDPLVPIYREDAGHTEAGACTTIPLEGMADHPGFNVNGFFEAGNGAMALVPTGHEDSYCASGTGAPHEKPMQEKVFGAIEPVPFNETDRMSLVLRCTDPPSGCDHRLTLSWGALAGPRYDAEVGPAPTAG